MTDTAPIAVATNQRGKRSSKMSLSAATLIANSVFFAFSSFAVVASIVAFLLARASEREKDRELAAYQASADQRIAEADRRASEANERASRADLEARRLEVQILEMKSPRDLSDAVRAQIAELCRKYPGFHFDAAASDGDYEAAELVYSIAEELKKGGWMQSPWLGDGALLSPDHPQASAIGAGGSGYGITVFYASSRTNNVVKAATELAKALQAVDSGAEAMRWDGALVGASDTSDFHLFVGRKTMKP